MNALRPIARARRKLPGDFSLLVTAAPVIVAVVMQVVLLASVVWMARASDERVHQRLHGLVAERLADLPDLISRHLIDTAVWNSLADITARETLDAQWLSDEVAGWFSTYFSYTATAVMDTDGRIVWVGDRHGTRPIGELEMLCPACMPLAEKVRLEAPASPAVALYSPTPGVPVDQRPPLPEGYPILVEAVEAGGLPSFVAATPILHADPARRGSGPFPVLLLIQSLDTGFLEHLGTELDIEELSLSRDKVANGVPVIVDGREMARLTWAETRPASDSLAAFMPVLAIFTMLMTALVILLAVWLRRTSIDKMVGQTLAHHLALHDVLTGLGNRARFTSDLVAAIAGTGRSRRAALLLLDLDGFKAVNDTYGHPVGDELIREIAGRIRSETPDGAYVSRIGGDEFAVVLTGREAERATENAERIIAAARLPIAVGPGVARVGCSIGIAYARDAATDQSELMRQADIALYRAKGDGRNCYRIFDSTFDQRDDRREGARPAILASTNVVLLAEAERTFAVDMDLVPATRRGSLPLARLLRQGLDRTAALDDVRIILPISPADLSHEAADDAILMTLDEAGVSPRRIGLKVTDGLRLNAMPRAVDRLRRLRASGMLILLPDFGTRHVALADLSGLPIDVVQISAALFRSRSEEAREVARMLVRLARLTGADAMAEGIDDQAALAEAMEIGCIFARGRLFGGETFSEDEDLAA